MVALPLFLHLVHEVGEVVQVVPVFKEQFEVLDVDSVAQLRQVVKCLEVDPQRVKRSLQLEIYIFSLELDDSAGCGNGIADEFVAGKQLTR